MCIGPAAAVSGALGRRGGGALRRSRFGTDFTGHLIRDRAEHDLQALCG